jgi:hypothetical protein
MMGCMNIACAMKKKEGVIIRRDVKDTKNLGSMPKSTHTHTHILT